MFLSEDEKERIEFIKNNFHTRHKWTKQDYSDFYYRDITLFLNVIRKNKTLKNEIKHNISICTDKMTFHFSPQWWYCEKCQTFHPPTGICPKEIIGDFSGG